MATRPIRDFSSLINRPRPPTRSSNGTPSLINERQLSVTGPPTTYFVLFENKSSKRFKRICFLDYQGTRAGKHHSQKLYLAQMAKDYEVDRDETYDDFANHVKQVLASIPQNDLSSYVITVRTGVAYFFSKRFRFRKKYTIEEIHDILHGTVPLTDENVYVPARNGPNPNEHTLRSSFANVKPISQPEQFVEKLNQFGFHVKTQKYIFRVFLQSEDKQKHVCTVDPALNYSIVEFSKDLQRMSNIDFIRDRGASKFRQSQTYDDVFDFRIQFQYEPRTANDQSESIENQLRQQFPSLSDAFQNAHILRPADSNVEDHRDFHISEQLCPYIHFIRRDYGDVYQYDGDDETFANFTIFLESSTEYQIDHRQFTCRRHLDTRGLVYARMNLSTMLSDNQVDSDFIAWKLWDMGIGLTTIAGECTTSETQQATNYYTADGSNYNAEHEAIVQIICKQIELPAMLGLTPDATDDLIETHFQRIITQLGDRWKYIRSGQYAHDRLVTAHEKYFQEAT